MAASGHDASTPVGGKEPAWRFQYVWRGGEAATGQVHGSERTARAPARVQGLGHRAEVALQPAGHGGGDTKRGLRSRNVAAVPFGERAQR
jgi:hypothetical protein